MSERQASKPWANHGMPTCGECVDEHFGTHLFIRIALKVSGLSGLIHDE